MSRYLSLTLDNDIVKILFYLLMVKWRVKKKFNTYFVKIQD